MKELNDRQLSDVVAANNKGTIIMKTVIDSKNIYEKELEKCKRIVRMLEDVSSRIGSVPATSMLYIDVYAYMPFYGNYWYRDGGTYAGYVSVNTLHLNENFPVFGELRERYEALCEKHGGGKLGGGDPAFEILRHLKNTHWGTRDDSSYPNVIAQEIINSYCHA